MRVALVALLLACPFACLAQGNPFRARSSDSTVSQRDPTAETTKPSRSTWARIPFSRALLAWQRTLTTSLTSHLARIQDRPRLPAVAGLLLLAMVYGIVHSLGPGHAKVLFVSHTIANPTPLSHSLRAGALFAGVHTGTATGGFFVARALFGSVRGDLGSAQGRLLSVSGALVIVAGLLILVSPYFERYLQPASRRLVRDATSLNALAVIAGLAPCPGAFLILVYANFVGIVLYGLLAVVAVSVGMALTVSLTATAGNLLSRQLQQRSAGTLMHTIAAFLRCAAGVAVVCAGLLMLTGAR